MLSLFTAPAQQHATRAAVYTALLQDTLLSEHDWWAVLTNHGTRWRNTFNFVPNTERNASLQYFATTFWVFKVCPFHIDFECETTHAYQFETEKWIAWSILPLFAIFESRKLITFRIIATSASVTTAYDDTTTTSR